MYSLFFKQYFYKFLYIFTKRKIFQYKYKAYSGLRKFTGNKIIVVKSNGERLEYGPQKYFKNLDLRWQGNNNILEIKESSLGNVNLNIKFQTNDNRVVIGENCEGTFSIDTWGHGNKINVGNRVRAIHLIISVQEQDVINLGNNCMISSNVWIFTEGHSVIDKDTKDLITKAPCIINVGNHVWLGLNTTLLKNASVPDDCIVGMGAIVTKQFTEPHCVLAGNPAKVCKTGVSWNSAQPLSYDKNTADLEF